ncbi:MAG: thioredoxin family protein [Bacteroidetes bacterium]|jgi:thioredoxin-related protein|nr:MAG: thioredoxin family protein [Bacteroidota bacterium]
MHTLLIALFGSFLVSTGTGWETDFSKAQQSAQSEHKLILLNFSGSDWCGPCIRMHKEIFEKNSFSDYATDHLVLVNADFPRLKKHELSKGQQEKNDKLASRYDIDGVFPLTVLLTADGKILKEWKGFPSVSSEEFTNQVKAVVDANK